MQPEKSADRNHYTMYIQRHFPLWAMWGLNFRTDNFLQQLGWHSGVSIKALPSFTYCTHNHSVNDHEDVTEETNLWWTFDMLEKTITAMNKYRIKTGSRKKNKTEQYIFFPVTATYISSCHYVCILLYVLVAYISKNVARLLC